MKTKMFTCIILALMAINTNVYAGDEVAEKLDGLRESLRKFFIAAPKLNVAQKTAIFGIIRLHREEIRENAEQLRREIIEARREFRRQLTREQLLAVLDIQDEFRMRPPAMKAAYLLKKLEAADRVELLDLLRQVWRDERQLDQNLDLLFQFHRTKILPLVIRELSLSDEQQAQLYKIADEKGTVIRDLAHRLLQKIFVARSLIRTVLTAEQRAFIEENRDRIFQEIRDFAAGL